MIAQAGWTFLSLMQAAQQEGWFALALKFIPFALFLELPLQLFVVAGIVRYAIRQLGAAPQREHYPSVSCVLTCYSEGDAVRLSIDSLVEQNYPGMIEIIAVVDGAIENQGTLRAARACQALAAGRPLRRLVVLPKWQRGGRVSSLNAGLSVASGEIVMALDGDTSFDNDMVESATWHFEDPRVVSVAGCLRARNASSSLAARLQGLEYMLSIAAGKTGLSEFNIVNNISGAFGVHRRAFLRALGGWDSGAAEDLDLTLRIKQYFARHPDLRIVFEPHAIGHTDVPDTLAGFFRQRLRWDGDLYYLFVRKYRHSIRPSLLGWPNFLSVLLGGLFFQLVMPVLILFYTIYLFLAFEAGVVLGTPLFVYLIYFSLLTFMFFCYLLAISERPREDSVFLLMLPIYPVFAFASRIYSGFAMLVEIVLRTHLDTNMAPWWVLRKTKF